MGKTISVYTEPYTKYVIQQLIGIKGKSESEVASYLLKEWIGKNREELKEYGITVTEAKKKGVFKDLKKPNS